MAALKQQVKVFIVQHLACMYTPSEVADEVEKAFDTKITRFQVALYDPTTIRGSELGEKLKVIFFETRQKFLDDYSQIPIANKSYRLLRLQINLEKLNKSGNVVEANKTLEQAAKEEGGFFTNKLKIGDLGGRGLLQGFYEQIKAKPLPIAYEVKGQVIQHAPQNTEVKEVVEEAPKPKKSLAFAGRD